MLQYFKGIKNRILPSRRKSVFLSKGFEEDVVKNNDVVKLKVFNKRINNYHRNIGFIKLAIFHFFEVPPPPDVNINVIKLQVFRKRLNNRSRKNGYIQNPIRFFRVVIPPAPSTGNKFGAILTVPTRSFRIQGYRRM